MTGATMITAVLDQGGFDVARATALSWLNSRYMKMVRRSEWQKAQVSVGTTLAATYEYALPAGTEAVLSLAIAGEPVTPVGTEILRARKAAVNTRESIYAADFTTAGVEQIEIWPEQTAGLAITAVILQKPTALADGAGEPLVPEEFHEDLVDGAIALGLGRVDGRHDEAAPFDERFNAATLELKGLKKGRIGRGPRRFRVNRYA